MHTDLRVAAEGIADLLRFLVAWQAAADHDTGAEGGTCIRACMDVGAGATEAAEEVSDGGCARPCIAPGMVGSLGSRCSILGLAGITHLPLSLLSLSKSRGLCYLWHSAAVAALGMKFL